MRQDQTMKMHLISQHS